MVACSTDPHARAMERMVALGVHEHRARVRAHRLAWFEIAHDRQIQAFSDSGPNGTHPAEGMLEANNGSTQSVKKKDFVMKKIVVSGLLALGFAAIALSPETSASAKDRIAIQLGSSVSLGCQNPGSSQDVEKTPIIKNTTGVKLDKGHIIWWHTNGGETEHFALAADLLPGATTLGSGGPGNGYSCTANIFSMPDLIPSKVEWLGTTALKVDVKNLDPFVPSEAAVTRLEVMSCSGDVLQTYDSAPMTFAKNEAKTITFPAKFVPGKAYLRITADATKKVLERNETNNVYDGSGSCVH